MLFPAVILTLCKIRIGQISEIFLNPAIPQRKKSLDGCSSRIIVVTRVRRGRGGVLSLLCSKDRGEEEEEEEEEKKKRRRKRRRRRRKKKRRRRKEEEEEEEEEEVHSQFILMQQKLKSSHRKS